jgi:hypothetical protein
MGGGSKGTLGGGAGRAGAGLTGRAPRSRRRRAASGLLPLGWPHTVPLHLCIYPSPLDPLPVQAPSLRCMCWGTPSRGQRGMRASSAHVSRSPAACRCLPACLCCVPVAAVPGQVTAKAAAGTNGICSLAAACPAPRPLSFSTPRPSQHTPAPLLAPHPCAAAFAIARQAPSPTACCWC